MRNGMTMIAGLAVSGLLFGGCVGGPDQGKANKVKNTGKTQETGQGYICYPAKGKIIIDGVLDELDWQRASVIEFIPIGTTPDGHTPTRATGRLLYDKNNLYIAMEAQDKDIWATLTEHDADLFNEDVLEAFFKPKKDNPMYFEFEWSPNNVLLDLVIPGFDRSYESNARSAVKIHGTLNNPNDVDEKWVLEVAIPFTAFKDVTGPPRPGDEWTFTLARYDYLKYKGKEFQLSATAKLSKPSFHSLEDYDVLHFHE